MRVFPLVMTAAVGLGFAVPTTAAPPKLSIFRFDVNTGDATLVLSPDKRGVLIDAGDRGRGRNPISEFLDRAENDGALSSIDFTVVTHYDSDHIGGMDEVYARGFYPAIAALDRGNSNLRSLDVSKLSNCQDIDLGTLQGLAPWGTAPSNHCPRPVTCQIAQYFTAAEAGGRRRAAQPGEVLELDHGLKLHILVANATTPDSSLTLDQVYGVPGRRDDCAENDLSVGVLVEFGDFLYLIAGDLTGVPGQGVADVEELIRESGADVDVYHVNHHGAETSSSDDFVADVGPTVAIVSNGPKHGHPRKTVIEDSLLSLDAPPVVYLTNHNKNVLAWQPPADQVADANLDGFDGLLEIGVWKRSFRVWRWRDGGRIDSPGRRFFIKEREN